MSSPVDIRDYKDHLEKFFWYMYNNSDVNAKCPQMIGRLESMYYKLKNDSDCDNWSLSITPGLVVPIGNDRDFEDRDGFLALGGKIEIKRAKFVFFSFSVSIIEGGRLVRRFHFDINAEESEDGRPLCHLQYGGDAAYEQELFPGLECNLDPWLKKPRFPFPPFDIVLLLDMMLRQVETTIGKKFVKEGNWRSLVKKSERVLMSNYYDYVHSYFEADDQESLFHKLSR